jgi:hypothetical protein
VYGCPAPVRPGHLLLPIVKGYGSEKSYEQLAQSSIPNRPLVTANPRTRYRGMALP